MAFDTPAAPYTLATLKGGAQGLFYTRQATPLAHVIIVVGAGYLDEPPSTPGLAHLLEHVLLTQPGPQGASLLSFTEQLGGKLNARTDDSITDIHATLPVASLARFLACLREALFTPAFDETTIASESAAIEAEYQARRDTPTMRRLAGLRELAENDHPGAFCHHGSRESLERAPALLKSALERFHGRYYTPSRLTIGLAAPLTEEQQRALVASFLPDAPRTFYEPSSSRWARARRQADIRGAASSVELLWPLGGAGLAGQMEALKASEQALNAGALTEPLAGLADDYQVALCPSGASDTLSLTVQLPPEKQRALLKRTANITLALNRVLERCTAHASITVDHTSLAEWLFSQTRQQALAQRFTSTSQDQSGPGRLATSAPYALCSLPAGAPDKPLPLEKRPTSPVSVISQVGASGTGLPAHWLACFYPQRQMALPALGQKRLAAKGMALLQDTTPRGSWLCAYADADAPLLDATSELMAQVWLKALPDPEGLQAHRLLAELTPSPATPLIWASNPETAAALSPLLATLPEAPTPRPPPEAAPNSPLVTLMRTLRLPGSDIHRRVLAFAARRQGAPFFHAVRQTHRLGYIAAVRFMDGDPASLAYIVQCPRNDLARVKSLIQKEIDRLWAALLKELAAQWPLPKEAFTGLDIPETPGAVLVSQWRAYLNATRTPLYRLSPPEGAHFSPHDWRQCLDDPDHWAWWQRAG